MQREDKRVHVGLGAGGLRAEHTLWFQVVTGDDCACGDVQRLFACDSVTAETHKLSCTSNHMCKTHHQLPALFIIQQGICTAANVR